MGHPNSHHQEGPQKFHQRNMQHVQVFFVNHLVVCSETCSRGHNSIETPKPLLDANVLIKKVEDARTAFLQIMRHVHARLCGPACRNDAPQRLVRIHPLDMNTTCSHQTGRLCLCGGQRSCITHRCSMQHVQKIYPQLNPAVEAGQCD